MLILDFGFAPLSSGVVRQNNEQEFKDRTKRVAVRVIRLIDRTYAVA